MLEGNTAPLARPGTAYSMFSSPGSLTSRSSHADAEPATITVMQQDGMTSAGNSSDYQTPMPPLSRSSSRQQSRSGATPRRCSTAGSKGPPEHSEDNCNRLSRQCSSAHSIGPTAVCKASPRVSGTGQAEPASGAAVAAVLADDSQDYLRARREAKELAQKEEQLDAALRALKTSELPPKPSPEQMAALLSECRR